MKDGAIESVDEFKGRIAENRRWPAGLHTAIEAKEGLALKTQGRILGSITLQNLISLYPMVCGMTGTAATQADEFRLVYGLEVAGDPDQPADDPGRSAGSRLRQEMRIRKGPCSKRSGGFTPPAVRSWWERAASKNRNG